MMATMERQLPLLETRPVVPASAVPPGAKAGTWRLDSRTRVAGKRGIAAARLVLAEAARRDAERSAAA